MTILELSKKIQTAHKAYMASTVQETFESFLHYHISPLYGMCYGATNSHDSAISLYMTVLHFNEKAFHKANVRDLLDDYICDRISMLQMLHLMELECCPKVANKRTLRHAAKKGVRGLDRKYNRQTWNAAIKERNIRPRIRLSKKR